MSRFSKMAGYLGKAWMSVRVFGRDERGGMAPFMVLGIAGVMVAGAYAFDATRMTTGAAQLKRATDAAAMAVAVDGMGDPDMSAPRLNALAEEYVRANLGMDSVVSSQLGDIRVEVGRKEPGRTYKVLAELQPVSVLLGAGSGPVEVHSTAYAENPKTEVAIILPSEGDFTISAAERTALAEIASDFVDDLFGGSSADTRANLRVAVVPHGDGVNVTPQGQNRISRLRQWVPPNIVSRPVDFLDRTFPWNSSTPRVTNHAAPLMPDTRTDRLCLTDRRQTESRYWWRGSAAQAFTVNYRLDQTNEWQYQYRIHVYSNNNSDFFQYIVDDLACPRARFLPLDESRTKIKESIWANAEHPSFNQRYSPGLIWAGRALSPDMRGAAGWGDPVYPLDFETDNSDNRKYIVMFAKLIGDWFLDPYGTTGSGQNTRRAFEGLCREYVDVGIKTYFLGLSTVEPDHHMMSAFGQVVAPGMKICTDGDKRYSYVMGSVFNAGSVRTDFRNRLKAIAEEIQKSSSGVRLIE